MADLTTYLSIRGEIHTGDLLACSGKGVISWMIKRRTSSVFSHVGLLVRLEELGIERVFLLHSTAKTGVVLLPVSRYLPAYKGSAYWVPMNHALCAKQNPTYRADLLKSAFTNLGREYDARGVLKFAFPMIRQAKESYYCSELASQAYKDAGLINVQGISPGRMVTLGIFDNPVSLI